MSAILNIDFSKTEEKFFYTATDLTTNKILATGIDIDIVVSKAEETGLEFVINYIPNPKFNYIF